MSVLGGLHRYQVMRRVCCGDTQVGAWTGTVFDVSCRDFLYTWCIGMHGVSRGDIREQTGDGIMFGVYSGRVLSTRGCAVFTLSGWDDLASHKSTQ